MKTTLGTIENVIFKSLQYVRYFFPEIPEDLLTTHAARCASDGAIFHVPPPMHIKFASPATACESLAASMYISHTGL